MKASIQSFLDDDLLAIVGASPKQDNFGRSMMTEIMKSGKKVIPVNPGYPEVEGRATVPTVKDLPKDVKNVLLAVPGSLTPEILEQCAASEIKRVWFVRGAAKGKVLDSAIAWCTEHELEYVYGFCPMMFLGTAGIHKFHYWMKRKIGKLPAEYRLAV